MARVQLGLSDGEFYRLTPRQFHLLVDQHRECIEHQELLAGIIASTIANWSMRAPKQPLKPTDYMPSHAGQQQEKVPRKLSKKARARALGESFRAFAISYNESWKRQHGRGN